jgi:hypothetical protein
MLELYLHSPIRFHGVVLKFTFAFKGKAITESRKEVRNDGLPNIRWVGHVTRMGEVLGFRTLSIVRILNN